MRLFIAINFEEEILNRLYSTVCEVKNLAKKGNFSRKENLHVTLAFLGEVEPEKVSKVKACMDVINSKSLMLRGAYKRGINIYRALF